MGFRLKRNRSKKEYLDEAIYGANDGIITTFAVISGATGASLGNEAIIILGLANLLADGFSMGVSSYLAIRTEEDVKRVKGYFRTYNLDAFRRSAVTFGAFVVAGILPMLPFFGINGQGKEFLLSSLAAGLAFFLVGASRSLVTKRGFFVSGAEMLLVGGVAATLAYSTGSIVRAIIS